MKKFNTGFLGLTVMVLVLLLIFSSESRTDELLQFTANGHVMGFQKNSLYMVGGDHMLKVTFPGARNVSPVSDTQPSKDGQVQPLSKVTYPNLWEGITLIYETTADGVAKSSFYLEPGADVTQIRLAYNVPVHISEAGELEFYFETGQLTESAPVAWQNIDGSQVFVEIAFQLTGNRQVAFKLGAYDSAHALVIDPTTRWNTFLGGSGSVDRGFDVAVDGSGNVYVTGYSNATWGTSPVSSFSTANDIFVAKLNTSGELQWHTFLGGVGHDYGHDIATDGTSVFITGYSTATWGSPVRAYSSAEDAFVAKLNASTGALTWNTFLGSTNNDYGSRISVNSGNVYVCGYSFNTWGSPVTAHTGGSNNYDGFIAKLSSAGAITWNTFNGSSVWDQNFSIWANGSIIYITGNSATSGSWGSPLRAKNTANWDAYASKFSDAGALTWNTFLGGGGVEYGRGITSDGSTVYVAGYTNSDWIGSQPGDPSAVRARQGGTEGWVAKLSSAGAFSAFTYLGSSGSDVSLGIIYSSSNVWVSGSSSATWGSPVRAYTSGTDAYAAKLTTSLGISWLTFLGGSGTDNLDGTYGDGIAHDGTSTYVAGFSTETWDASASGPVRAFDTSNECFVAEIDASGMVPVELSSFTASSLDNAVVLQWVTESEAGGVGFIIERRNGANADWQQIASYLTDNSLVCMNNTIGYAEYNYTDNTITANAHYFYRLSDVDIFGNVTVLDIIEIVATGVNKGSQEVLPEKFSLIGAYPNPFNPETTIAYQLPQNEKVTLRIYNLRGELVKELVNGFKGAGYLAVVWDGKDSQNNEVNSGIYLIKMQVGNYLAVKKATLLR